ncbi:hypothetical protein [Bradyrhizobium sp. LB14.3]|uniref:hypothetical protein n=1 Tax=Bradyrhizobium sp. LB14.3 TaxID=3156328 RepID=UPI0033968176
MISQVAVLKIKQSSSLQVYNLVVLIAANYPVSLIQVYRRPIWTEHWLGWALCWRGSRDRHILVKIESHRKPDAFFGGRIAIHSKKVSGLQEINCTTHLHTHSPVIGTSALAGVGNYSTLLITDGQLPTLMAAVATMEVYTP